MNLNNNISYFRPSIPYTTFMGLNGSKKGNGVAFAFDAGVYLKSASEIGVIIYTGSGDEIRLPFTRQTEGRIGTVMGLCLEKVTANRVYYNFYADNEVILDPYAREFTGNNEFGVLKDPGEIKCVFSFDVFDFSGDVKPFIPYEKSIFYGLNVRSFTKDRSSKIKHKGTFLGVSEKIPYLKELGITSIVLMPSYEFDECENLRKIPKVSSLEQTVREACKPNSSLLNCWGFTTGFYYAPKSSYSFGKNSPNEFKQMVLLLHKSGLELIMQFYFPSQINSAMIPEILRFWVREYHVDGFRISGFNIPQKQILSDPILMDTKLWFDYIDENAYDNINNPLCKNIACLNGNYRNDIRRFLKGDEGLVESFISYQKIHSSLNAYVDVLCDYDGFSLRDLYSYERKHNENNLENNYDGESQNHSWNCGTEGETRKKYIQLLRIKQIKNALTILMLGHACPYIFAGDEFGNTRNGNNNSYCQDNETGYVVWNKNLYSNEILSFCKQLIRLRKENSIWGQDIPFKNIDTKGIGYPDLSYHGYEAYRPDLSYNSRCIGMFYCGAYSSEETSGSFYIGINMHWEDHSLAIPKLKNKKRFKKIIDTGDSGEITVSNEIPVGARSIVIYEVQDQ